MPDTLSLQKTLEQGRAKVAYDSAEEGNGITKKSEYKAYVKKIPMLIKANGLGATFAYVNAKSSTKTDKAGYAYHLLYQHTTKWLKDEPKGLISDMLTNDNLVKVLIGLNSHEYRAVTNEVLAFLVWLKRFAEGLIKE